LGLVGIIPTILKALNLGRTTNIVIMALRWVLITGFFLGGAVLRRDLAPYNVNGTIKHGHDDD